MSTQSRRLRFVPRLRRRRDERGAYAVLFSMMLVLFIALAAIAVDIASQVSSKQMLKDTMDSAAHAAAFELPDNAGRAAATATTMARANDRSANPVTDLWCVVASTGAAEAVNTAQIPSTCNPGAPPYTAANYRGLVCDEVLCFIPCRASTTTKCNTIRVADEKIVPYRFAPAIGYDEGSTGAVVSVACKGSCGTEQPNPLDIVIMADRTASMNIQNREAMKSAILRSLETMNPEMHHVAFGTLHKSRTTGFTPASSFVRPDAPRTPTYENCSGYRNGSTARTQCNNRNTALTNAYNTQLANWESGEAAFASSVGWNGSGDTNGDGLCRTEAVRKGSSSAASTREVGTWMPVPFSNDYLTPGDDPVVRTSSGLVDGVSCLGESASGEYGTHLAGAMKGAANYVLGGSRLPGASTRPGALRKVIIFETDGQPDEVGSANGSTVLSSPGDVFGGEQSSNSSSRTGKKGCENFIDVARRAKDAGILVITIGFGDANTAGCERYINYTGERNVRDVLAEAASPVGTTPSTARNCNTATNIAAENNDGDYYYCAVAGDELAEVFRTALSSLAQGITFLRMPR